MALKGRYGKGGGGSSKPPKVVAVTPFKDKIMKGKGK